MKMDDPIAYTHLEQHVWALLGKFTIISRAVPSHATTERTHVISQGRNLEGRIKADNTEENK